MLGIQPLLFEVEGLVKELPLNRKAHKGDREGRKGIRCIRAGCDHISPTNSFVFFVPFPETFMVKRTDAP